MDQESSLFTEPVSIPQIVAPNNNDSCDGQAVTVSGTADSEVVVRVWDWLSPVATTTADGKGNWSVTLHDVEIGDHMYAAEAFRDAQAPSGRSKVVAVRVASQTHASAEPLLRASRRWKLPTTSFARKVAGHRRSKLDDDDAGQSALEGRQESAVTRQQPASVVNPATSPLPSEQGLPPAEDMPLPESAALHSDSALDPVAEHETIVKQPPIEVTVSMVVAQSKAIEATTTAFVSVPSSIDLGVADTMPETYPSLKADTEIEAIPRTPERVWTERIIVEQPPIV
jgi:hypothetical protein